MVQKIHFITYGNDIYNDAKKRICEEMANTLWCDTVLSYGPDNLTEKFKGKYKNVLQMKRGAGYWIWKYDILRQQFDKMNDNDIIIYCDAGCTINPLGQQRFNEYIKIVNDNECGNIGFQLPYIEKEYTVKEIFDYMGSPATIISSKQLIGGVLIMRKCKTVLNILQQCFQLINDDSLLITDYYNNFNHDSFFIENRHDQSIMSVVRKQHGTIIIEGEVEGDYENGSMNEYPFWSTRLKN